MRPCDGKNPKNTQKLKNHLFPIQWGQALLFDIFTFPSKQDIPLLSKSADNLHGIFPDVCVPLDKFSNFHY